MTASQLMLAVERHGGTFYLDGDAVECKNCPKRLAGAVRENGYLIRAILRQRQASLDWERDWACHCPARSFAHPAHKPEDVWKELKAIVRATWGGRVNR